MSIDSDFSHLSNASHQPQDYLAVLQEIARSVRIVSRGRIEHPDLNREDLYQYQFQSKRNINTFKLHWKDLLKKQLTRFLYERYFSGLFFLRREEGTSYLANPADHALLYSLQQANQGCGYFEEGWHVVDLDNEHHLFVNKDSLTLWVSREFHLHPDHQHAEVGNIVSIRWPSARPFSSPGFYMALSNRPWRGMSGNIVRFYFNTCLEGAIPLMREITGRLNEVGIGFRFKICSHPKYYVRRDTAVLYISREDYLVAKETVATIHRNLRNIFSIEAPPFTKFLLPGLALAEDPHHNQGEIESFGWHRSRLLAEGLLAAYETHRNNASGRLNLMIQRILEEGLKLDCFYLNPGNDDIYEWN